MQRFKNFGFFLIFFLIGIGCTKDQLIESETNCPPEPVTYNSDIKAIVNATCAYSGCHDGAGNAPGDYNSYGGISVHFGNGEFESRTITLRDMPPSYVEEGFPDRLTSEQINLIECWIEQGFLEE